VNYTFVYIYCHDNNDKYYTMLTLLCSQNSLVLCKIIYQNPSKFQRLGGNV
jgi:hypothetical protein